MSATKEMWMAEVDQCEADFTAEKIDAAEFRERMARLGFDPDEIDDHLEALTS